MPTPNYQTLNDFFTKPFGHIADKLKLSKYETAYQSSDTVSGLRIEGYTNIEDSFYIHVKVPSESQSKNNNKYEYDIVIKFFTPNPLIALKPTLSDYYIQIFSNSPGFIYKYAILYMNNDFLIRDLYEKLESKYRGTPPSKTNANNELFYDRTIYFACRYLLDKNGIRLRKFGLLLQKKKTAFKFFSDISDFASVRVDLQLLTVDKRLKTELNKNATTVQNSINKVTPVSKVTPTNSSTPNTNHSIKVVKAGGRVNKIKPGKTTARH